MWSQPDVSRCATDPDTEGAELMLHARVALVIDSDPLFRQLVRSHLSREGFIVTESADGSDALQLLRANRFDIIVLDMSVPDVDGISLCKAIRSHGPNRATPILIASARGREADKVLGLESGADDYIVKPIGTREFVVRVSVLLRRNRLAANDGAQSSPQSVRAGDLTLDLERHRVVVRGRDVEFSRQEFELLHLLASRSGIVFSRAALLAKVSHRQFDPTERAIDAIISRLRKKIELVPNQPRLILTVWCVGDKFSELN